MEANSNTYLSGPSLGVDKLRNRWVALDSMAGVGIDPDIEKIPLEVWDEVGGRHNIAEGITYFNERIIDATIDYSVDYKVNANFFQGEIGRRALAATFSYLKNNYPDVVRICDGKFADVDHTAEKIAEEIFGNLDADAVLLNPYLGVDAIRPFTRWKDKLVILCVNTSNSSANSVQNLELKNGEALWRHILKESVTTWNENNNIIPVLSATHPKNIENVREIIGDIPIVLAGVGSQGGSLAGVLGHCLDSEGYGIMVSSSRAILYPDRKNGQSFTDASTCAIKGLKDAINAEKQAHGR